MQSVPGYPISTWPHSLHLAMYAVLIMQCLPGHTAPAQSLPDQTFFVPCRLFSPCSVSTWPMQSVPDNVVFTAQGGLHECIMPEGYHVHEGLPMPEMTA